MLAARRPSLVGEGEDAGGGGGEEEEEEKKPPGPWGVSVRQLGPQSLGTSALRLK